jgi:lysophospholipase L1-like esterase
VTGTGGNESTWPARRWRGALALVLAAALALAAPAAGAAAHKGSNGKSDDKQFYVSLGDSYAEGYQPNPAGGLGSSTKDGFAYKIPKLARKRGYDLELVNFACGGESTTSILERTTPCPPPAVPIGAPDYSGQTQVGAAENFIRKHRHRVRLITVSIGGNDITGCANSSDPFACVADATQKIKDNIATLMARLRAAGRKKLRIVGLTYPDVILGGWVNPGTDDARNLAAVSVVAFRDLINPAFKQTYEAAGGVFVDITAATAAYIPLDQTTVLDPYGEIPVAVATICRIGWFCELRDIHLKPEGYLEMAKLIAETLPKKK